MNVNEYGIVFLLGASYDMSSYTSLSLTFIKPDGFVLTRTNPDVSINPVDQITPSGVFVGNTYGQYTFQDGDIDQVGAWTVRLIYHDPSRQLISNLATFTVNP